MYCELLTDTKRGSFHASLNILNRRPEIFNLAIVVFQQLGTCDNLVHGDCLVVNVLIVFIRTIIVEQCECLMFLFILRLFGIVLWCLLFGCCSVCLLRAFILIFLLAFRCLFLNSKKNIVSPTILHDNWQPFSEFQIVPLKFCFCCQAEVSVVADYQINLSIFVEHSLWHNDLASLNHRLFRV